MRVYWASPFISETLSFDAKKISHLRIISQAATYSPSWSPLQAPATDADGRVHAKNLIFICMNHMDIYMCVCAFKQTYIYI